MAYFGSILLIAILVICVGQVTLQPEQLQWELVRADDDFVKQFSSAEPLLLKTLLASYLHSKKNSVELSYNDPSGQSMRRLAKKGLGIFRHGRPTSFYKSFFGPANTGSFSGFGLARYGFDRPRPLRWG